MARSETWVVRHDAYPQPVTFTYTSEQEALDAFERGGFYDPATGWGVTLIHRVVESEILKTTKPNKEPR